MVPPWLRCSPLLIIPNQLNLIQPQIPFNPNPTQPQIPLNPKPKIPTHPILSPSPYLFGVVVMAVVDVLLWCADHLEENARELVAIEDVLVLDEILTAREGEEVCEKAQNVNEN